MARARVQRCESCQEAIFTPRRVEPLLKITACRNCSVQSPAQTYEMVCANLQGGRYGNKKFAIAWLTLDMPLHWDHGRSPSTYMEFDYVHENTDNRATRSSTSAAASSTGGGDEDIWDTLFGAGDEETNDAQRDLHTSYPMWDNDLRSWYMRDVQQDMDEGRPPTGFGPPSSSQGSTLPRTSTDRSRSPRGTTPRTARSASNTLQNVGNRAARPSTRIRLYKQHFVDAQGNTLYCQRISFKNHFTREWTLIHGGWKVARDGRLELNFTHRGEGRCVYHNFIEINQEIVNEVVFTAKKVEGECVHHVFLKLDTYASGTGNWKESLPATLDLYFEGCEDRTVLCQWHMINY